MKNVIAMIVVAAAFLAASAAETAQAQVGGLGWWGIGHESFGQVDGAYRTGRIPTPPYFAIHPPVYYSQPVPRSYGHSPFAYPGSVRTPDAAPAAAKIITNPHIRPAKTEKQFDGKLTLKSQQLEILNPFVDKKLANTKLVSNE